MNEPCNIIRDLMPLVIDEAASEDSVAFVKSHTETCSECAAYYQGMRAMLPKTEDIASETKRFSKATKKLRMQRWKRLLAWACAGVLLTLFLCGIGLLVYHRLTGVLDLPMRLGDYDVTLSALKNGQCVTSIRQAAPNIQSAYSITFQPEGDDIIAYVALTTAHIPQQDVSWTHNARWERILYWDKDGLFTLENDSKHIPVNKVCKGTPDDFEIIYTRGDTIAAASGSMEEYFAQLDERDRMRHETDSTAWEDPAYYQLFMDQEALVNRLEYQVLEWNSVISCPF